MAFSKLSRLGSKGIQKTLGTPIAIDFGTSGIKVLQITSDDPPALVTAGYLPTPENLLTNPKGRFEYQLENLPSLVQGLPLRGRRAVCAIPMPFTFCKHAQFARQEGLTPDLLADTMLSEQLGRDASTLVRRLIEVDDTDRATPGTKAEFICLATGREVIQRIMKSLKSARLEPVGMHSEFESIARAFAHVNRRDDDRNRGVLYLDIGARQTLVTILHGTSLVFARTVDIGGTTLDECLARELSCSLAEARARRLQMNDLAAPAPVPARVAEHAQAGESGVAVADDRRVGAPAQGVSADVTSPPSTPTAPAGASLREPLEILTDEIGMCMRYHDAMYKKIRVESIIFVGGEARHRGLCQHVARRLRLSAQVADPLARISRSGSEKTVNIDLATPQPGWAVAAGLCESPTDL